MTRKEQIAQACARERSVSEERAFTRGALWADAHPADRWIPIEEELPKCYKSCGDYMGNPISLKESEPCLVLTKSGKIFVATLNQDFDEEDGMPTGKPYWFDEHPEAASDGCWLDFDVTHWMYAPLPPRKENSDE